MKKYYVPSMDGIPGMMPGHGSLLPDPIEGEKEDLHILNNNYNRKSTLGKANERISVER